MLPLEKVATFHNGLLCVQALCVFVNIFVQKTLFLYLLEYIVF